QDHPDERLQRPRGAHEGQAERVPRGGRRQAKGGELAPPRILRLLVVGISAAFVAWLVWDLRAAAVWSTIHALRWRPALVLFVPFTAPVALDTLSSALLP